ncbi:MAG: HAMP domain-containing histidine kinase [Streptosporangiales bacterium]|nr:HAMP domain-containing histidine kinase [Streptosporangiales bacterium]
MPQPSPKRRWRPRTMRGRLIAGLVALLTIACATVGVTSFFAIRDSLILQLDNQLQIATNLAYKCQDPIGSGNYYRDSASASDRSAAPAPTPKEQDVPVVRQAASTMDCPGLMAGTIAVSVWGDRWKATRIPGDVWHISAADKTALGRIEPSLPPRADSAAAVHVRNLHSAPGDYALTAIRDPDGDGTTFITGLPLSGVDDLLKDVAILEITVFAVVLVAAGVLGTFWVRLSLRPLSRVAATASAVAELPLDTGEAEFPAGVGDTDPATETGQVGAAFNRMLGHVEQALARRSASETRLRRFAADASHELRTPLAAIRGYAELALRHPGEAPEPVTHALGRVLSESTRMTLLVDDLLLLARLDAGRPLSYDAVDVSRLVIDATSDAQVARPGHRWMLDLPDDPVQVWGDEHRLHQVLANLLSNAGRHTPDGTTVTVRLAADSSLPSADPDGEAPVRRGTAPPLPRAVLSITDDGPGIPAALLPELFERFTRADSARTHASDSDTNSTGLGLAIVDAVVAAHGGAVLASSRPGLTRFTIALPRLDQEPDGPSDPEEPEDLESLEGLENPEGPEDYVTDGA